MSKVGFFQQGWRGKFGDTVFQKGENGTVSRPNKIPTNPQADGQMYTRVAFSTISKMAAEVYPIIGPSFQGVNSIKKTRRRFMQLNMSLMISAYQDPTAGGFYAAPKDVSTIIPGKYIVSKGTLPMPSMLKPTKEASGEFATVFQGSDKSVSLPFGSWTAQQLWYAIFETKALQITSLAIVQDNVDAIMWSNDSETDFVREGGLRAVRIKLVNPGDVIDITADTTQAELSSFMGLHFPCAVNMQGLYADSTVAAGQDALTLTMPFSGLDVETVFGLDDASKIKALGNFVTNYLDRSGIFQYSTCQLDLVESKSGVRDSTKWSDIDYYGASFDNALPTYIKARSAKGSEYFTQMSAGANSTGDFT